MSKQGILTLHLCVGYLLFCEFSLGFIAYDCGGPNVNLTKISIVSDTTCKYQEPIVHEQVVTIQLVQRSEIEMIKILQCKIVVSRIITYCGMHSHGSAVLNGYANYVKEVGRESCIRMHEDGSTRVYDTKRIDNLKSNQTTTTTLTLAGKIGGDGSCTGSDYSDYLGSWSNVVVQAILSITLTDFYTQLSTSVGLIYLPSGVQCHYLKKSCIDIDGGETWWDMKTTAKCDSDNFDVLYQGLATKVIEQQENEFNTTLISFFATSEDSTFGLAVMKRIPICGILAYQTQHPKLMIIVDEGQGFIFSKRNVLPHNMDLFLYMNTKFVYVEKHTKKMLKAMYRDLNIQRCNVESQVIQNQLSIAKINPTEFAYLVTQQPGYTCRTIGEIAHIIKCQPVEVSYRKDNICYDELPITYNNQSVFMTSRSHLIKQYGTEVSCNDLVHSGYLLGGKWYSFTPIRSAIQAPIEKSPTHKGIWKYESPGNLANDGLYSKEELESLKHHIMFPLEKPSLTNMITRNMMGLQPNTDGVSGGMILTETDLKRVSETILTKTWAAFKTFGTVSSGLMTIYLIFLTLKYILSIGLNSWTLYKLLGCGFHLMASIMDSCTHFILGKKYFPQYTKPTSKDEDQETNIGLTVTEQPVCTPSKHTPKESHPLYPAVRPSWEQI